MRPTNRAGPAGALRASRLAEFARYFLRLGTTGFGGPVALVERMRRDLVEARGWFSASEFKEGLALAQLSPGPLAAQLAIYLGWLRAGLGGATLAGVAFIGPSFVMVLALSALYVRYGGLSWIQGAFYGVGAAAVALIAISAFRLAKRTIGSDGLLAGIALANAVITVMLARELVAVMLASGVFAVVMRRRHAPAATLPAFVLPPWLLTGMHGAAAPQTLLSVTAYFAKSGAVVFGSGLAIVPFLHGGVVTQLHWLTERQFLDAVAVSMITPGPVVITVAFIGYLVAGPLGSLAAAIGVFLPVYVVVVGVSPSFHRLAAIRGLRAAIDGVTAAAVGAIAGAVLVLGRRAVYDVPTAAIFVLALLVLMRGRAIREPILIVIAAGVGAIIWTSRGPG